MIEFWQQPRTIYPSIFRVLIGIVLLADLIFTFPSVAFQYNPEFTTYSGTGNLISVIRQNYIPFFITYGLVLVLFITGIGKNISSLLVFICHFVMLFVSPYIINWGDVILKFTLLYFVFVDSFRFYSFQKTKENVGLQAYVSKLAIWCIILNLFLIYLSNGIYKSFDIDWQKGFAPFYSFSQFSDFENSLFYPLLTNGITGKITACLVLLQQLTFIPLVLWRKTRFLALIVGIVVHSIMFFQFGLWKFEIIIILLYGFLLNDSEIRKIIPAKIT